MFIEPDDYLLIMDMNEGNDVDLTLDEMHLLKDVGVKTLYYWAAFRWDRMQPTPTSPINWGDADRFVERARKAGLKMLLPFVYSYPKWKPDEFFHSRELVEHCYGIPNYINEQATAEIDELMREAILRYWADDVQVIWSIPGNGEFPFHIWPRHGELECPMESLIEWVLARQRVLVQQHNEIWTMYHPYTAPKYWHPLYDALFAEFPDAKHYGIIFTYVQHLHPHFMPFLQYNKDRGMTYYGGTEYVQGMEANVPRLLGDGVRMLTAPKHMYQPKRAIEPWMLDEIEKAIGQYDAVLCV